MNYKWRVSGLAVVSALIASYAGAAPAAGDWFEQGEGCSHVVLFGNGAQTWVWNGENWQQKTPKTSPTGGVVMAFDKARHEVILLQYDTNDNWHTWAWNGEEWSEKHPAVSPSPNSIIFPTLPGMAYDAVDRDIVLYEVNENAEPETWVWDGNNWAQKSPASSPAARSVFTIADDAVTGRVLLFGGQEVGAELQDSDTWEWDGNNWTVLTLPVHPDGFLGLFSMAYDHAKHDIVLFGRSVSGSAVVPVTWLWNGSAWVEKSPKSSPPVTGGPMAYDPSEHDVLFFTAGETWTWNGFAWIQKHPTVSPADGPWLMSTFSGGERR